MLTSRAEHRLRLRTNNAAQRLTPIGLAAGCVGVERARRFARGEARRTTAEALLERHARPSDLSLPGGDGVPRPLGEWLRFPDAGWDVVLAAEPGLAEFADLAESLVEDSRYQPYLARQDAHLRSVRTQGAVPLPTDLDYHALPSLSLEMRERLTAARPATLGEAERVRGVTPAALAQLLVAAKRAA